MNGIEETNHCLSALKIGQNTIGSIGIELLSRVGLKHLELLDLFNTPISSQACSSMSQSLSDPMCVVQILSLSGCRLGDDSACQLASSVANAACLRELNLSHNAIGDQTCHVLANSLMRNRKLTILNLSKKYFCKISYLNIYFCFFFFNQKTVTFQK